MIPLLRALTSSRGPMPMFWRYAIAVCAVIAFFGPVIVYLVIKHAK